MFPWSPEFVWDIAHIIFFGALYSVLAAIGATLGVAAWRSLRDHRTGRVHAVAWHADFEDLPRTARACRHQLTGEAPGRVCENGFDCRCCGEHACLQALRRRQPACELEMPLGLSLPPDRLYHRGHTEVRRAEDGSLEVKLDEIARRLVGSPEKVELPAAGSQLRLNAPAVRVVSRGREVRVLSPVDGTVLGSCGEGASFSLRVAVAETFDARHLLSGHEAQVWAMRELERLQQALAPAGSAPELADGGELVADVGSVLPPQQYDAVLGEMLLEP